MIQESETKINSLGLSQFRPLPFLKSGMAQTLASACWPHFPDSKPEAIHTLALADSDHLIVVEDRPSSWKRGDRIVLLVHGLAGNHQSNYMVRVARRLGQKGFLTLRVNLRGCGIGFGLAKKLYHSGRSEDLRSVLHWMKERFPDSPVTQVGFSLGANITLKMAGEDGSTPTGNLDSLVAISPPVDLSATAEHLKKSKHVLFDQFFVWKLRYDIWRHHLHFTELPRVNLPLRMALTDLDDLYTAPRSGFRDAQDYYLKSSSGPLVSSIRVRGLILCAEDDPIVNAQSYSKLEIPAGVDLIMTPNGGHVGFIGETGQTGDVQWMDSLISRWVMMINS